MPVSAVKVSGFTGRPFKSLCMAHRNLQGSHRSWFTPVKHGDAPAASGGAAGIGPTEKPKRASSRRAGTLHASESDGNALDGLVNLASITGQRDRSLASGDNLADPAGRDPLGLLSINDKGLDLLGAELVGEKETLLLPALPARA